MSLFSSAIFQEDKEPSNKFDFFDEESNNFNPLDNSFSLMSEENKLKNPIDLFESQSQLVNSKNNSDIDKECSPAPAPLRSSQSQIQTDLGASHNMECPEVVQETEGAINNGYFKENGIDVELTTGQGADAVMTSVRLTFSVMVFVFAFFVVTGCSSTP